MLLSQAITLVFQERGGLREKLQTARGYERDARHFCVFVRNPQIENVRLDDVEEYFVTMENSGFSRNGIQMKACALRKLFSAMRKRGYIVIDPNDIPLPRKEFKETKVATDEQLVKVLEVLRKSPQKHCRLRNIAITLLLRDTGMSRSVLQQIPARACRRRAARDRLPV
jgi:site-specific recombinase XerD